MEQVIYLNAQRQPSATDRLKAVVGALDASKAWRITIAEMKSKRSSEQNSLLWAIYSEIIRVGGEAMQGHTKDELHEFFLGDFFGWEIKPLFGKKKQVPKRRSSKLNKQEFSDFVEHILRFMAERGVYIETET
jgi:hypothetical protein